jgi:hypothetical protein
MRTVTGLIRSRENYRVSTETVSIGIRGTHYWLVSCNQDCRNPDGSLGADGDYGLVREGSVEIATTGTRTGSVFGSDQIMHVASEPQFQREFSSDQVFRVARKTGQIQQLIGPPGFLFAPIGGIGATKPPVTPPAPRQDTAAAVASTGQRGDPAGDTRVTSTISNNTNFTFLNVKQQSATVAPSTDPVLQATSSFSTQGPAAVLEPTFGGTVFYRLAGTNLNIPTTCTDGPCDPAMRGQIIVGVNFALQRAVVRADLDFGSGDIINFGTPSPLRGVPITISGNQVTFSGTLNRVDFPENNGAFRCSKCGPGNSPGFADQITFNGTINGSQLTITLGATDAGGSGSLTTTLPLATPPNNAVAAMAIQRASGGTDTRANAFWGVQLGASGELLKFGPNDGVNQFGNPVGGPSASIGSASNAIAGAAPTAGNLVWGRWTGPGASLTGSDYITHSPSTDRQPWITGEAPNNLPPSLGTLTFTPIGSVFSSNSAVLNSASLTANFVNRTVNVSINATNTNAANTFQMNGSTGFSPTSGQFAAGFATVTCSGPCNGGSGSPSGSYGGFFAGQQAQGAGVVFSAGFGTGTGVTGAVGFKR